MIFVVIIEYILRPVARPRAGGGQSHRSLGQKNIPKKSVLIKYALHIKFSLFPGVPPCLYWIFASPSAANRKFHIFSLFRAEGASEK